MVFVALLLKRTKNKINRPKKMETYNKLYIVTNKCCAAITFPLSGEPLHNNEVLLPSTNAEPLPQLDFVMYCKLNQDDSSVRHICLCHKRTLCESFCSPTKKNARNNDYTNKSLTFPICNHFCTRRVDPILQSLRCLRRWERRCCKHRKRPLCGRHWWGQTIR